MSDVMNKKQEKRDSVVIERVLVSVSDKTDIERLCRVLHAMGIEILSTGGTATALKAAGIPVIEVSDYTGFPEIMDGRLKTLHPKIEGGILGRRGIDDAVMAENGILPIDMVVCNLYPFEQTVAKPGCTLEEAIENIDIGGPTMIRAAAKNWQDVAVVTDPSDYFVVLGELGNSNGSICSKMRFLLASRAFTRIAAYDNAIDRYLLGIDNPLM